MGGIEEGIGEIMIFPWISKSATYMVYPELNYIQVKFGVNPCISSEVISQNVI